MKANGPGIGSRLLGVRQVAELLQISTDFVYSTMKRHVPYVKVGGALRFRQEDIDRFIATRTIAPSNTQDIKSPIDLREVMGKPRKTAASKIR